MPKKTSVQEIARYGKDNLYNKPGWLTLFDSIFPIKYENRTQVVGRLMEKNERVLDIGAGDCFLLKKYGRAKFEELTAVDLEKKLMDKFDKWANKNKIKSRSFAGNFESFNSKEKFDCVCALAYLEHVVSPFENLKKISNILKKGGLLIIEVPNVGYLPHRISLLMGNFPITAEIKNCIPGVDDVHIRFYTLSSLKKLLNYCGFEIITATSSGRLAKFRQINPILWSDIIIKAKKVEACPELNPIRAEKNLTLFIDGIITPYQIARYNVIHKNLNQSIVVWFQDFTEKFRDWNKLPKINFDYQVLDVSKINVLGADLLTLRINKNIVKKLNFVKDKLNRIVITGWDQPICLITCLWAKKNGIKVTLRAGSTAGEKSILRTITKSYVKWFVKLFDDYISYGTASSEYLVSLGAPKNKIFEYFNTVDVDYFVKETKKRKSKKINLRKKLGISASDFVIISSGRFVKGKNFLFLIKVFKKFRKFQPKAKLIIMGSGPEMEICKAEAGNLLNRSIYFPGFIQHNKLVDYYLLSDIFVLPSLTEVWGLVVNEALACGLPVITSNVAGCVPDLIIEGKTGFVFNPSSSEQLLKSLKKVHKLFLDKKKFLVIGNNCQKHMKKYTIEKNVKKLKVFWGIK
jgi:glycosyltransferase involved in cell wall biosynthesis